MRIFRVLMALLFLGLAHGVLASDGLSCKSSGSAKRGKEHVDQGDRAWQGQDARAVVSEYSKAVCELEDMSSRERVKHGMMKDRVESQVANYRYRIAWGYDQLGQSSRCIEVITPVMDVPQGKYDQAQDRMWRYIQRSSCYTRSGNGQAGLRDAQVAMNADPFEQSAAAVASRAAAAAGDNRLSKEYAATRDALKNASASVPASASENDRKRIMSNSLRSQGQTRLAGILDAQIQREHDKIDDFLWRHDQEAINSGNAERRAAAERRQAERLEADLALKRRQEEREDRARQPQEEIKKQPSPAEPKYIGGTASTIIESTSLRLWEFNVRNSDIHSMAKEKVGWWIASMLIDTDRKKKLLKWTVSNRTDCAMGLMFTVWYGDEKDKNPVPAFDNVTNSFKIRSRGSDEYTFATEESSKADGFTITLQGDLTDCK